MAKNSFTFEDNSKAVKKALADVSESSMEEALLFIEAQAKSLAPVGTGELRDHIDHQVSTRGSEVIGKVGSPHMHAIYNEFGTGEFAENGAGRKGGWSFKGADGKWHKTLGLRPRPFLRPAFKQNKKRVESIIGAKFTATFK